jgi:hypothetical protein
MSSSRPSARDRNLLECHQEALSLDVREREVDVPGVACVAVVVGHRVPIEGYVLALLLDPLLQPLGEVRDPLVVGVKLLLGDPACLTNADGQGWRESATSQTPFLSPTTHLCLNSHSGTAPNVDRANSLRAVNLVAADRHHVDVHFVDVDGDLSHRLSGIGVEKYLVLSTDFSDFGNRLINANLVVDSHHRHHAGIGTNGSLEVVEANETCMGRQSEANMKKRDERSTKGA